MEFIRVERYRLTPDWTIGRLFTNGRLDGFTVEDEIRTVKIDGETAIPFGTYQLGLRQSPKFSDAFWWSDSKKILVPKAKLTLFNHVKDLRPHDLIWIKNVPNFEYVLIHWGNTDLDSRACLIVGDSLGVVKGREAVLNSRKFYAEWYQEVYLDIKKGDKKIEYLLAA